MKRVLAIVAVLLALVPGIGLAADIITVFPNDRAIIILPADKVNGSDHILLTLNLANLNAKGVIMNASGEPAFENFSTPWLSGQFVSVQQVGASFAITWNVSVSTGGLNPTFTPIGPVTVTITP